MSLAKLDVHPLLVQLSRNRLFVLFLPLLDHDIHSFICAQLLGATLDGAFFLYFLLKILLNDFGQSLDLFFFVCTSRSSLISFAYWAHLGSRFQQLLITDPQCTYMSTLSLRNRGSFWASSSKTWRPAQGLLY